MTLTPSRAARRLVPALTLPVLLCGSFAASVRPALALELALKQDDKPAVAVKKDGDEKKDAKTYTIQRKYKAGDVNRYNIGVDVSGAQSVTLSLLLKNTIKDVKADGGATILGEFEKATAVIAGGDTEITGFLPTLTQTFSAAGKLTDLKTEGGNPAIAQTGFLNIIKSVLDVAVYPPTAIKPGDTWEYHTDTAQADQKLKGTATFVGLESVDGMPTYKIKTLTDGTATAPNPATGDKVNIKTHAEGTQNLDAATGKVVKVQTSVTSKVDGGVGDFAVKLTIVLVTGDAAAKPGDKPADKTGEKKTSDKDGAKPGAGR